MLASFGNDSQQANSPHNFWRSLKQVTSFHQRSARLLSKSLAFSFCPLSINKASITSGPALVTELATILCTFDEGIYEHYLFMMLIQPYGIYIYICVEVPPAIIHFRFSVIVPWNSPWVSQTSAMLRPPHGGEVGADGGITINSCDSNGIISWLYGYNTNNSGYIIPIIGIFRHYHFIVCYFTLWVYL